MFPDDAAAEQWFIQTRWPNGVACHYCGSTRVLTGAKHKTMPFRCREKECRKRFSARTGTVLESSNLGFQLWAIAIYLLTTNLKGISSMKLHRELAVSQKTAWFLAHRLREAWADTGAAGPFVGPVEADETFIGGKAKNMHAKKRKLLTGRGGADKTAVAGVRDRTTKKVRARVVQRTDGATLGVFAMRNTDPAAPIYTDESPAYIGIPGHEAVKHGAGEYVRGAVHTNGMESFWSMLKRGYVGTYHRMSPEHLDRYVSEFEGRHNARDLDTIEQMRAMVRGSEGRRLKFHELTAHPHGDRAVAVEVEP